MPLRLRLPAAWSRTAKPNPEPFRVFVSYSKDRDVARHVCTVIEATGAVPWMDDAIEAGEKFEDRLLRALDECAEHVILLSPGSVTRPYVWMELGAAWVLKRKVIGILNGISVRELRALDGMPNLIVNLNLIDSRREADMEKFSRELGARVAASRSSAP